MIRYDFPQREEEWQRARLGIPTASEFHKIITPKTGKLSSQAEGYMHVLLAEWMLGAPLPSVETEYMTRGAELEDAAVKAYEFETGLDTELVGFCTTDDGLIGCSPDRLVLNDLHPDWNMGDDSGCLEIKCPAANTHVGYMLQRSLDEKYAPQTQGQLLITGRAWVDTVSYYPGLPTVVIRSPRDEKYIALLKAALDAFVEAMLKAREAITQRYGQFPIGRPKPVLCERCGGFGKLSRVGKDGSLEHYDCPNCAALGVSEADVAAIWAASQEVL